MIDFVLTALAWAVLGVVAIGTAMLIFVACCEMFPELLISMGVVIIIMLALYRVAPQ